MTHTKVYEMGQWDSASKGLSAYLSAHLSLSQWGWGHRTWKLGLMHDGQALSTEPAEPREDLLVI